MICKTGMPMSDDRSIHVITDIHLISALENYQFSCLHEGVKQIEKTEN